MQFQFSFKHMDRSEALQSYAEDKIREKVSKFVTKPINANVFYSVIRHTQSVHLSLDAGDGFSLEVESAAEDMYAAVDLLVDKLESQLKKHKDKLKDHKAPKLAAVLAATPMAQEDAVDAADILKYEQGRRRANSH